METNLPDSTMGPGPISIISGLGGRMLLSWVCSDRGGGRSIWYFSGVSSPTTPVRARRLLGTTVVSGLGTGPNSQIKPLAAGFLERLALARL